jgi:hypothetical protein
MWLVLLLLAFVTSACRKEDAQTQVASCLVGQWVLAGDEAYAWALLPPGAFEAQDLLFKEGIGMLTYTFSDKGDVTLRAQWAGKFDVKFEQEVLALYLEVDGQGGAKFTEEGDLITVSNLQPSLITHIANFADIEMVNTLKLEDFAPLFTTGYRLARFTCDEKNLRLQILNRPQYEQPITFVRFVPQQ